MNCMESHFYFFLRYELHLNMNFDVGGFCMLLNFLIEGGDQSSTAHQESLLFLPKPGANIWSKSQWGQWKGCHWLWDLDQVRVTVRAFIYISKILEENCLFQTSLQAPNSFQQQGKYYLPPRKERQGSLLHAAMGPLHFLHQDCWISEICFPSPWKSKISYDFL